MNKHTKYRIIFFVTMLLASFITFSVLFLLPLIESGRAPPNRYTVQRAAPNFVCFAEIQRLSPRIRTKGLTFHDLKRNI